MVTSNPRQGYHKFRPPLNLRRQPAFLGRPFANETPKVPTTSKNIYPRATEELLRPFHIPQGHDRYTIGRFREVSLRWPSQLQVPEVFHDVPGYHLLPHFICLQWFGNAVVYIPEISDEREEPYAVCDNV